MTYLEEAVQQEASVLRESLAALNVESVAEVLRRAKRVHLVGTGTSQHAAEFGAWILRRCGLDARWWSSATAARAAEWQDHTVIVISHTGETAFARTVREQVLKAGSAPLLALTGTTAGWPDALCIAPREKSRPIRSATPPPCWCSPRSPVSWGHRNSPTKRCPERWTRSRKR